MVTLEAIKALVRDGAHDPYVKRVGLQICRAAGVSPTNRRGVIAAVHQWIRQRMPYRNDPHGNELIVEPKHTLKAIERLGYWPGDCDDMVVAEAALLDALLGRGTTRFVIMKADKRDPEQWSHILLQAKADGQWISLDPIMKQKPVGWHPPRFYKQRMVPVGPGPGFRAWAQRAGMEEIQLGGPMPEVQPRGAWVPGQMANGNAMARELPNWAEALPLVGYGAILSQSYEQGTVPGWRPVSTGDAPAMAYTEGYWRGYGHAAGTMAAQPLKSEGYGQEPTPAEPTTTERVTNLLDKIIKAGSTVYRSTKIADINRERLRAGLPPLRLGAEDVQRAVTRPVGGVPAWVWMVGAVVVGGGAIMAIRRRRR